MTLAELIQELAAATDGATEDTNFTRAVDKLFPEMTALRVMYKKRGDKSIVFSQIQVYVENIGTPQEAAFYPDGRIPDPVVAKPEPIVPNATPEEIKANLDTIFAGKKYSDIIIQTGEESGIVSGVFYDAQTGEATKESYIIHKDDKETFTAYLFKG